MKNQKITSLNGLIEFVDKYFHHSPNGISVAVEYNSDNHPILLEWFLDYFFTELIKDKKLSIKSIYYYTIFTIICEDINYRDALKRVRDSLEFWDDRAGYFLCKTKLKDIFLKYNGSIDSIEDGYKIYKNNI